MKCKGDVMMKEPAITIDLSKEEIEAIINGKIITYLDGLIHIKAKDNKSPQQ